MQWAWVPLSHSIYQTAIENMFWVLCDENNTKKPSQTFPFFFFFFVGPTIFGLWVMKTELYNSISITSKQPLNLILRFWRRLGFSNFLFYVFQHWKFQHLKFYFNVSALEVSTFETDDWALTSKSRTLFLKKNMHQL